MTHEQFIKQVFEYAKAEGFDSYELYMQDGSNLELSSFEGEIIKYADSTTRGVNFRGIYQGKLGSAFSECLDGDAAKMLVDKAKEAAALIEVEDRVFLFGGAPKEAYKVVDMYNPTLEQVAVSEKIDLVLGLEKTAMASGKLSKVAGSYYGDGKVSLRMLNSEGLDVAYTGNRAYAYMGAIGTHQSETYSAYTFGVSNDFEKLKRFPIADEAVTRVVNQFSSKTVHSGAYRVIIENRAAGNLLDVFMSLFSADAAQKGMSLFKGKVGEQVAAPCLDLVDDPHLANGLGSCPFDGEGVPTKVKHLIQGGQLKTLLHNLKTAHKDGVQTTGNASRGSYQSVIGVSHTNAYIVSGSHSVESLKNLLENGLMITGFDGLHAGANAITGDFSLGARGFMVEKGEIVHPVNQIVVSGNFMTLFKGVLAVGDDLIFETSPVGSPSLLIDSLSVAGA